MFIVMLEVDLMVVATSLRTHLLEPRVGYRTLLPKVGRSITWRYVHDFALFHHDPAILAKRRAQILEPGALPHDLCRIGNPLT
jgi:hypothetical protein